MLEDYRALKIVTHAASSSDRESCRSDMASSAANRAAFISSLKSFMAQYGFQGVDLGKFAQPRGPP